MIKSILIGTAVLAVAIPAITTTYADKTTRSIAGDEFRGPDVVAWYTGGSGLDLQLYGAIATLVLKISTVAALLMFLIFLNSLLHGVTASNRIG